MLDTLESALEDQIRDLYSAENQIIKALPKMAKAASNDELRKAFEDMLANMSHGGKIAMLGIPAKNFEIDWRTVIFSMITIKGIYGREMYETWYKMSVMLHSGLDIAPVITHRIGYADFEQGFEIIRDGKSGKVVMDWEMR